MYSSYSLFWFSLESSPAKSPGSTYPAGETVPRGATQAIPERSNDLMYALFKTERVADPILRGKSLIWVLEKKLKHSEAASFLNWWGPILMSGIFLACLTESATSPTRNVDRVAWFLGQRQSLLTWYVTLSLFSRRILYALTGQRDLSGPSILRREGYCALNLAFILGSKTWEPF